MTPDQRPVAKPRRLAGARLGPAKAVVDGAPAHSLEYGPPVADWLAFLAELLAAEFLKELDQGGDGR